MSNKVLGIVVGVVGAIYAVSKASKIVKEATKEKENEVADMIIKESGEEFAKKRAEEAAYHKLLDKESKAFEQAVESSEVIKGLKEDMKSADSDIKSLTNELDNVKANSMSLKVGNLEVNTSDSYKISELETKIEKAKETRTNIRKQQLVERENIRDMIESKRTKAEDEIAAKGQLAEDWLIGQKIKFANAAKENRPKVIGEYLKKHHYDKTAVSVILYAPLALAAYGAYKYYQIASSILNEM